MEACLEAGWMEAGWMEGVLVEEVLEPREKELQQKARCSMEQFPRMSSDHCLSQPKERFRHIALGLMIQRQCLHSTPENRCWVCGIR